MNFNLTDATLTESLGRGMAHAFPGAPLKGAVVHLQGELGAGKTLCVRSLLRALGVTGPVRSPTYTLLDTYAIGALTCIHVDLYRLQSLSEVEELGLRDLLLPATLLLIEWPERGFGALPPADLNVLLRYVGEGRQAHLTGTTPLGVSWVEKLGRDNSLLPYVFNLT